MLADASGAGKAEPFPFRLSRRLDLFDATKRGDGASRDKSCRDGQMAGTGGKRGAAAAPPLGLDEAPAAGSAPSPWQPVRTREMMHLDNWMSLFVLNTDKPGPMQFKKG